MKKGSRGAFYLADITNTRPTWLMTNLSWRGQSTSLLPVREAFRNNEWPLHLVRQLAVACSRGQYETIRYASR